jgi:hypothetical protein
MSWLLNNKLLLVVIKWADRYLTYNVMIINNKLLLVVIKWADRYLTYNVMIINNKFVIGSYKMSR